MFHIVTRGAGGISVYRDDPDRLRFLSLLHSVANRFEWRMDAFCLMTTHYHLVAWAGREALSAGLHRLNGLYASGYNRRHGRRGHLFGDRFWAALATRSSPTAACSPHAATSCSTRFAPDCAPARTTGGGLGRATTSSTDQRQAVSETGARSFSGSHQARFARYHSTVSRSPCPSSICGSQPSSRRIFVESSR